MAHLIIFRLFIGVGSIVLSFFSVALPSFRFGALAAAPILVFKYQILL
jgi:hypothetical protein